MEVHQQTDDKRNRADERMTIETPMETVLYEFEKPVSGAKLSKNEKMIGRTHRNDERGD